ncbi:MAG: KH domain-containing protein [Desulfobacterales bacterium]|nr:KH domain-containing protein [Desulfobacterales bacterium]
MSSFEFEGKNLDKAVKKACEELNQSPDDISYEVLSRGSSSIFGLAGAKKAKIRVNLPEKQLDTGSGTQIEDHGTEIPAESEIVSKDHTFEHEIDDVPQIYSSEENPSELGRSVLQRIIDAITSDAKISVEENSEGIRLNVACSNAALLIGKKGQTLAAMQSIVEKIINKHNNGNHKIRIQVDVEGYLETRKSNLERLAARLADKSKRIRKPISLGQMSAHDRRIIHMALKDDPDVRTKSRGEGYMRKIVIFPQKNSMRRQHLR